MHPPSVTVNPCEKGIGVHRINARPLAWHDLVTLYRYRHEVQSLDTALTLTRGNPLGPWVVLDYLQFDNGKITSVLRQKTGYPTLVGQMRLMSGERAARLTFAFPADGLDSPGVVPLMEDLAWQAGNRGACSLLAEVDEGSPMLEGLRRAGFSLFAWQRVWKIAPSGGANNNLHLWEPTDDLDTYPIRSLYQALIPPLVQSAEPPLNNLAQGLAYRQDGELLAYVSPTYGPQGIYLQPLIHPGVESIDQLLASLVSSLPLQLGRPIYLSVRSYQAWLEPALEMAGALAAGRQALMVKHLAVAQRALAFGTRAASLEKQQPAMISPPSPQSVTPWVEVQRSENPARPECL